jgi:hypothetical protein
MNKLPTFKFLPNPAEIRKAVKGLQGGLRLDLAVGFIGADWWDLLADHRGKLRVVCWLSSTNTNPYAVADLMQRKDTEVRQRHSLHSKVYLTPGGGAIVGSANLSKAALSEADISGQVEAALLTNDPALVSTIETWFDDLWKDFPQTFPIKDSHLAAAKTAWDNARASSSSKPGSSSIGKARERLPPLPKHLAPKLLKYGKKVRQLDLEADLGESCAFIQSLDAAKITKALCNEVVDYIVAWTGHRSSYNTFLSQPISEVRKGLTLLFDDSIDLQERLQRVGDRSYLNGLRIPSLSLLLYWRNPQRFAPYNSRTDRFLQDFDLKAPGMSDSSPRCYVTWLRWATRFAQQLSLPSPGHVDRMIEYYYEDVYR